MMIHHHHQPPNVDESIRNAWVSDPAGDNRLRGLILHFSLISVVHNDRVLVGSKEYEKEYSQGGMAAGNERGGIRIMDSDHVFGSWVRIMGS